MGASESASTSQSGLSYSISQVQGWLEDFLIEMGPRDIVYSGNIGVIAPISTGTRTFQGSFGRNARPGKCLRLKFSETQSSAFWTLKFSKCVDSKLNMYNL